MKFKAFGLIEAIIATAIILLFFVGASLLATKSSVLSKEEKKYSQAQKIAKDFFERVEILNKAQRISFDSQANSETISLQCLDSSQALACKDSFMDSFPLSLYPFNDLTEISSDNYLKIKEDYFKRHKLTAEPFAIKTKIDKKSDSIVLIEVDIRFEINSKAKNYKVSQIFYKQK